MKKIYITFLLLILVLPLLSAEPSFVFKKGDDVNLKIPVTNSNNSLATSSTNCTITIRDSNDNFLIQNQNMTYNSGGIFNYTLTNTTDLGEYPAFVSCGDGADNGFTSFSFLVSGSGEEKNITKGVLYIAFLFILILSFILVVVGYTKLPSGNNTDDYGQLLSINHLKYLRTVFAGLAWGILIAIAFTSSNIALSYIDDILFGNLLFNIFRIMLVLTPLMIIVMFIYLLIQAVNDSRLQKILKRGIDM